MSQTYEQIVDEMSLAVVASIEYLKKQGDSHVTVKNGKLVSAQGGVFLYEFTADKLQMIEEDADVEVRIGGNSVNGKIAAISDGLVSVEVESNFGTSIPEAKLIVSSYFLLEKLNEKLLALRRGEIGHTELAEKLFRLFNTNTALDEEYAFPPARHALNLYQERAVRLALGSEVTFIWGPPGTGKTFTIARLVEGLLSKGLSILLISHTNAATDNALLDVVMHLEKTEDYNEGRFLREGRISLPELAEKRVTIEKIIEYKAAPILKDIRETKSKLNEVSSKIAAHRSASFMLGRIQGSIDERDNLRGYLRRLKIEGETVSNNIRAYGEDIKVLDDRIRRYQQLSSFKKLFAGTNLQRLSTEKSSVRAALETKTAQLDQIRQDYKKSLQQYKKLQGFIEAEQEKLQKEGLLSDPEYEEANEEIKRLEELEKALQAELETLNETSVKEAKLIATTLTKSYQSQRILSREYDCVITDEASMAPMPALLAAAGIAKKKVIMVGDFFQLPPIAKYSSSGEDNAEVKQLAVDAWLRRDIFAYFGITQAIRLGQTPPDCMQQLRTQRRMHPDISELVNKLIYAKYGDYALKDDDVTYEYGASNLTAEPLPGYHLGVYDTSIVGSIPSKTDSGSIYNVPQALICIELVKQALRNGYNNIGVISAYRAQVNLMQKIIADSLPAIEAKKVLADTVHKFQGGEREVVIFDVTTPRTRTMYDDGAEDGDDEKLINVAFSRAKAKLLIVGDVKKIEKYHGSSSLIRQSIEHTRTTSKPILGTEGLINPLDLSAKTDAVLARLQGASITEAIKSGGLLDENDFYKAFLHDLINAEQEVIIISPFLAINRYEQFKVIFSNLRARGVQIYVVTRPSDEQEGNLKDMSDKIIKDMEKLGIVVLPIQGYTHQKIAIVDRKILYVGSLNILSQRASHEIMHRIGGKKGLVAKQYMQFLRLDKNLGPIGESKLRHCEVCNEAGSWYWTAKSRFGMWTFCLTGMHSPGKPPRTKTETRIKQQKRTDLRSIIKLNKEGVPVCPKHNIATVLKDGYWGQFYGCPNYKECDYAVPLKKVEKARAAKGL